MEKIENILLFKFLYNPLENWVNSLAVLLICAGLFYSLNYLLVKTIKHFSKRKETIISDFVVLILTNLKHTFVWLISLIISLKLITFPDTLTQFIEKGFLIFITIRFAWFLQSVAIIQIQEFAVKKFDHLNPSVRKQISPLMTKILTIIIWVIAVLLIIGNLGYNITSVIAGLGIGGIFIGLAAQETLSNLISSIAVFLDRPFNIGDIVNFNGTIGTIEDFGMKSTRIRTFEGTLVVVPNNKISKEVLTNISKRQGRRTDLRFSLVYNTSTEKLKEAIQIVKDAINSQTNVQKDSVLVHFINFGPSGLELEITYYIDLLESFNDVQNVREDINFRIKSLFEKAGIEFAYPTQTVYLRKDS